MSITKRFDPQPDITAYELAIIYGNVSAGPVADPLFKRDTVFPKEAWDALPPEIKRHWK